MIILIIFTYGANPDALLHQRLPSPALSATTTGVLGALEGGRGVHACSYVRLPLPPQVFVKTQIVGAGRPSEACNYPMK